MAVATVWLENREGQRWLVGAACSLGRSQTNDVIVDDGKVSRRHALIHKQDDSEYWLIDLGSGNGTYINGRRVTQPTKLGSGDELALGEHTLTFRLIAQRQRTEPPTHASAQTIINIKSIDCWLLVADIEGSTAMAARLTPTEMAIQVGRWMAACKEIVDTHRGSINKFLGDGFFAYWQAEQAGPGEMIETVAALRALQRDATGPRFRVVLHYGAVAFGGGGSLGEDSLSGLDVVLAFRMEKIAGSLGCPLMASEAVKEQLDGAVAFRDLGLQVVPGFEGASRRFYALT